VPLDQFEYRLLSEISHKLDYAIRSAEVPALAPEAGAKLDPQALRALQLLMTPCPPEVLHQRIMDAMAAATGAERGFLMMIEEGRKLRFKCGLQMDQQTIQRESGYSRSIIKQVVSTGDPVLIADSSKATDTSASVGNLNTKSILCVPLLVSGGQPGVAQVGGIAYLDARAVMHCFGPEELHCAQITAEMAVTALEGPPAGAGGNGTGGGGADNDKLQQNFERLLDVGRTISSTLVLDELLELVIEKVLEVTRADRGFLMLIEADDEEQEPQFKIGLTWNKKDGDKRRKRKLDQSQFFFSSTVTKQALETKRPVVLNDIQASMGDSDPSVSMMQMELSSVMVAPLIEKGKILGLIYVDSKMSNREFAESDVELFEALAGQAAIGLKNAMLYTAVSSQQRLESELALASKMQQDLCPETVPQIQGIELTGYMTPAREVGGDYYDFVEDDDAVGQSLAMVVGDVSGKGLGAGIVAVMARCFLRSMLSAYGMDDPSQLLGYLNHTLCGELKPGKFMTMLLMTYDARRSVVRYAAAGHENIIIWRAATRSAEAITSGGSPLGISTTTGGPTPNAEIQLLAGDTLVTYTDGVTEAMDMEDNEYELERLLDLVNRMGGQSPQVIMDEIIRDLAVHRGEREVTDDITMVLLRKV
tara:strand:+ start:602 stop:2542 length:1941 start_codon:yes stop_codon:yes gene_type:complete